MKIDESCYERRLVGNRPSYKIIIHARKLKKLIVRRLVGVCCREQSHVKLKENSGENLKKKLKIENTVFNFTAKVLHIKAKHS